MTRILLSRHGQVVNNALDKVLGPHALPLMLDRYRIAYQQALESGDVKTENRLREMIALYKEKRISIPFLKEALEEKGRTLADVVDITEAIYDSSAVDALPIDLSSDHVEHIRYDVLTGRGRQQASALGSLVLERLQGPYRIITSGLDRTVQTASIALRAPDVSDGKLNEDLPLEWAIMSAGLEPFFRDHFLDIASAVAYIEENPKKARSLLDKHKRREPMLHILYGKEGNLRPSARQLGAHIRERILSYADGDDLVVILHGNVNMSVVKSLAENPLGKNKFGNCDLLVMEYDGQDICATEYVRNPLNSNS